MKKHTYNIFILFLFIFFSGGFFLFLRHEQHKAELVKIAQEEQKIQRELDWQYGQKIAGEIHIRKGSVVSVSVERLSRAAPTEIAYFGGRKDYSPAPDIQTMLQMIQPYIYAFPGHHYKNIGINIYTAPFMGTKENEEAEKRGEYLFNIHVFGTLFQTDEDLADDKSPCGGYASTSKDLAISADKDVNSSGYLNRCDEYSFYISYTPKTGQYKIYELSLYLYALPKEIVELVYNMTGRKRFSSLAVGQMGWIKNNSGETFIKYDYFNDKNFAEGTICRTEYKTSAAGGELGISDSETHCVDVYKKEFLYKDDFKEK